MGTHLARRTVLGAGAVPRLSRCLPVQPRAEQQEVEAIEGQFQQDGVRVDKGHAEARHRATNAQFGG